MRTIIRKTVFDIQEGQKISAGKILKVNKYVFLERNWVFATNSNFLIPTYLQPDYVNFRYFKL